MSNRPEPNTSSDSSDVVKTLWHRLVGRLLEMILGVIDGISVFVDAPIMSDSPRSDILIIRRNSPHWTEEQLRYLPDGIRDTSASDIILEWKFSESVNTDVFQQATGYDFFYRDAKNLKREAVQTFVVSSQTTQQETLQRFGYTQEVKPGVYHSNHPLLENIPLLLLNQLSDEPHNTFFKIFASRPGVRTAAFRILEVTPWKQFPQRVWQFLLGLRDLYTIKGEDAMKEGITPDAVMEIGAAFREQLIANVTPEEKQRILASITPQEKQRILENITLQEKQRMFETATPAEKQRMFETATPAEKQRIFAAATLQEKQQLLATVPSQERAQLIAAVPVQERFSGLTPEQRLAGLSKEEMTALLTEIEAMLGEQSSQSKPKRTHKKK